LPKKSTNYFFSRADAGRLLAKRMYKHRYDDTIVLALSDGAVLVGAEIARFLHSLIAILVTKNIYLPDGRTVIGVVNEVGGFVYDNSFSTGEIEYLQTEYRNNIEIAKIQAMHEIHQALGQGGLLSPNYFRNRVVIVVSDGTLNGMAFEMAYEFLKGIKCQRVIMAAPIAGVPAVDRMHVLADELYCLNVTDSNFDINHYYENNDIPDGKQIIRILDEIILDWYKEDQVQIEALAESSKEAKPLPTHA
jgi:predicted phosphoribosyltransferase